MVGYIGYTIYWERRVAGYKRRASSNEGVINEKEVKEEKAIMEYVKNHCKLEIIRWQSALQQTQLY